MQGEEFYFDENVSTEEHIKSFITTDDDEQEANKGTECIKLFWGCVNQIKRLTAFFTLQKGDVDGYNLLKTAVIFIERNCSKNKMSFKQTNITQFFFNFIIYKSFYYECFFFKNVNYIIS